MTLTFNEQKGSFEVVSEEQLITDPAPVTSVWDLGRDLPRRRRGG
jgi:hypothetical protein